jgi:hypothetical protein
MFKYIILIAVDVIAVIGIIAVFMSVKRSRGHRSLRNPAPRRWGWSIASGKQQTADIVKDSEDKEPSPQSTSKQETVGTPVCSLCGASMVLRTTQKGVHAGKPFYGCSNYPKCSNTVQHMSLRDTQVMKNILR